MIVQKVMYWITAILCGIALYLIVSNIEPRDSFEDYIEWCEEEVTKDVMLYCFNIIEKPDTLPNGMIGYLNGNIHNNSFTDMSIHDLNRVLYLDFDVRDVYGIMGNKTSARCEPTLKGYQQWKQNKQK